MLDAFAKLEPSTPEPGNWYSKVPIIATPRATGKRKIDTTLLDFLARLDGAAPVRIVAEVEIRNDLEHQQLRATAQ